MMFVTALYSIDTDPTQPVLAAIYMPEEREIMVAMLKEHTEAGRFMATMELGGEDAQSAYDRYDRVLDRLFDHPDHLPLETTETGRLYLQERASLHAFLTGL